MAGVQAQPLSPTQVSALTRDLASANKLIADMVRARAHGEITVVIRDGAVQLMYVKQTILPGALPLNAASG